MRQSFFVKIYKFFKIKKEMRFKPGIFKVEIVSHTQKEEHYDNTREN